MVVLGRHPAGVVVADGLKHPGHTGARTPARAVAADVARERPRRLFGRRRRRGPSPAPAGERRRTAATTASAASLRRARGSASSGRTRGRATATRHWCPALRPPGPCVRVLRQAAESLRCFDANHHMLVFGPVVSISSHSISEGSMTIGSGWWFGSGVLQELHVPVALLHRLEVPELVVVQARLEAQLLANAKEELQALSSSPPALLELPSGALPVHVHPRGEALLEDALTDVAVPSHLAPASPAVQDRGQRVEELVLDVRAEDERRARGRHQRAPLRVAQSLDVVGSRTLRVSARFHSSSRAPVSA